MKFIEGGVCAAQGFTASGIHCGIRKNREKRDLALIVSQKRAAAAAVYTQNLVKGAPLLVTKANIADGYASAILCNSGNANTCNADGEEVAQKMCVLAADALGIPAADVVVASTGVIGQRLDISPSPRAWRRSFPAFPRTVCPPPKPSSPRTRRPSPPPWSFPSAAKRRIWAASPRARA